MKMIVVDKCDCCGFDKEIVESGIMSPDKAYQLCQKCANAVCHCNDGRE